MNREEAFSIKGNERKWLKFSSYLKEKRGNTCEHCGVKGKLLHSHHLEEDDYMNFSEENFLVLCTSCHNKVHGVFRSFGEGRKRSEEWLAKVKEHSSKFHYYIHKKKGDSGYIKDQTDKGNLSAEKRWGDYKSVHDEIERLHKEGLSTAEIANKINRAGSSVRVVLRKRGYVSTNYNPSSITNKKKVRNLTTGIIYESLAQAEKETGVPRTTISKQCRGITKTIIGDLWEFV